MNKLALTLIVGISLLVNSSLFSHPDFVDVHDPTAIYRLFTLKQTLSEGQFPAAWHNVLNYGFGYPLHLYYAPLFSYLGVILSAVGFTPVFAAKLTILFLTIVGGTSVYLLLRRWGRGVAFLGAVAFLSLPYHFSSVYVRGSFAEYSALNLLPLTLYFYTTPLQTRRRTVLAALVLALFLLSHNTIPYVVLPVLLLLAFVSQKNSYKPLCLALVLGCSLSAAFLFPMLFERSLVQVEQVATKTKVIDHLLEPWQLWYSPWDYGGSTAGPNDLMSFMLGKGQLILAALGLLGTLYFRQFKLLLLGATLLASLYFTTVNAAWFWRLFPLLSILQFPWRLLSIATLGLSIFAGSAALLVPHKFRLLVLCFLSLLLLGTNLSYAKPWNYLQFNPDILTNPANLYPLVEAKIPEYLPAYLPSFPQSPPSDGLKRTATTVSGEVVQTTTSPLVIQTAYMPHWQLKLNAYPTDIVPSPEGVIRTHSPIPPGTYTVELTWHPTTIEKLGYVISFLALITMIGLAL